MINTFILRGVASLKSDQRQSQFCANVVIQSYAKIVLKIPSPSTSKIEQIKAKIATSPTNKNKKLATSSNTANYNIIEQLK